MTTRFTALFALVFLGGSLSTSHALGAGLPAPSVDYSADRIIESDAGSFTGKVYATRDKERTEMHMAGMQSVMITRRDKQVGWMLMPAQKMYQQLDFAKAQARSGAAPDGEVEITQMGSETVEGLGTTKYKMLMKDGSAGGFIWITAQGIAVKMDMLSKSGKERTRVAMTLKNLQVGGQDASLFELPAGYTAMPSMGGFGLGANTPSQKSDHTLSTNAALKGALSGLAGRF
jgi:Domain of unknown function (DUF4412)